MRIQPRRMAAGGLKGCLESWRREIPDTSQPGMLSLSKLEATF